MSVLMNIITLGIVDLFDTMGTVVGCAAKSGLHEPNGKPQAYGRVMISDSIAAIAASLLGTSSVTTFIESGTGISAGGKTGLVAFAVSAGFFLALFFLPLFAFVPLAASGAALIYVGVLMMSTVTQVDFEEVHNAVPAFLTITIMPFSYSITKGIGMGLLSYVILHAFDWVIAFIVSCCDSHDNTDRRLPKWPVSLITCILALLFCLYFFVPIG
jgi:AGZA family xanthine/uracil permease-like MFS transporter